jgi:hypothetical protein
MMGLLVVTTGDYTPDMRALLGADVIICTPEKWDGISRNWQNRAYVKKVALLVIDEIHLLGADRCVLWIYPAAVSSSVLHDSSAPPAERASRDRAVARIPRRQK